MKATVHLWGLDGRPSIVSPESVALFWLLNNTQKDCDVTIVFSNNTDLSPNQELPLLIEGEIKLYGYANIARRFSAEESALEMALLQFTQDHICALSQYQLYLNKNNYDSFTRKVFAYLLEWPLWYNTPLKYRALARKRCETLGYFEHEDDPEQVEQPSAELDDLVQSKAFKLTNASKARGKELLKSARYNLQYMSRLSGQVASWLEARARLEKPSTAADFLLWANLFVQLELPDGQLVKEQLQTALGSEVYESISKRLNDCSKSASKLELRAPSFAEKGNVVMSAYHALQRFVSA
ncbi:LAQU0S05e01728g1_1 [Lachancea quebecensis]|uniref:LAQU0S05e01728g1_1 n=1 Tax=Lachancea quebecensis TaxID=1654605 RepID=A0A0P1KT89_9SACH|nr:LAQU0S05e01728g1_1 [Lachancea quebecensis]